MRHPTISELFDELQRDSAGAGRFRVQYDPRWHYPTEADIDPRPNAVDDEWQLTIRSLRRQWW
jgi:hypothetical protein